MRSVIKCIDSKEWLLRLVQLSSFSDKWWKRNLYNNHGYHLSRLSYSHLHTHMHQWQTKITVTGSGSHVTFESTNGTVEEAATQVVGMCPQHFAPPPRWQHLEQAMCWLSVITVHCELNPHFSQSSTNKVVSNCYSCSYLSLKLIPSMWYIPCSLSLLAEQWDTLE